MPKIGIDESNDIIHFTDLIRENQKKQRNNDSDIIDTLLQHYINTVSNQKDKEENAYLFILDYINKQREILNNLEVIIKERII